MFRPLPCRPQPFQWLAHVLLLKGLAYVLFPTHFAHGGAKEIEFLDLQDAGRLAAESWHGDGQYGRRLEVTSD